MLGSRAPPAMDPVVRRFKAGAADTSQLLAIQDASHAEPGTAGAISSATAAAVATSTPAASSTNMDAATAQQLAEAERLKDAALSQHRDMLALRESTRYVPEPAWHAPWKLYRVIAGHMGWVRCVDVEPGNEWFATGSADRTVKLWDLATGSLKLTLTGHISTVRDVAISRRHNYMFSCSEDKTVLCWDLETNQIIRKYTAHLQAVHTMSLHPTLDLLISGGRDAVARVWDIRTRGQVHCLSGHTSTITDIVSEGVDPQVITSSHDKSVIAWDLVAGKPRTQLTHHAKSVRALGLSPVDFSFVSGAADTIKKWALPDCELLHDMRGHAAMINTLAINGDGVMMSGGDDGTFKMWDYETGYCFQHGMSIPQPGSLASEACILDAKFDQTGSRLITCDGDKSIKMYRQDVSATPSTHPIDMPAWTKEYRATRAL